jgi:hypothetical protein
VYGIKIRESANDGSDFSNPDADYRLAFLGEDGLWHVKDSAGTVTSPYTGGGGTNQAGRDGPITSANKTTTSTTFVDVDATDFSITLTTAAKRVLIGFVGAVQTNATAIVSLDIDIDGSRQGGDFGLTRTSMATTIANNMSFTYMSDTLTAASHTFKLQWRTTAGTATLLSVSTNAAASLWVMELA